MMATTYNWTIARLERSTADGDVTVAHLVEQEQEATLNWPVKTKGIK